MVMCSNCWERIEIEKHSKGTPDYKSKFPLIHNCTSGGARYILEGGVGGWIEIIKVMYRL